MSPLLASAGPFTTVRRVDGAPFLPASSTLYATANGYFPDIENVAGWRARPAFNNANVGAPIVGGGTPIRGSHAHVDPTTQTIYRFFVVGGKLYRSNAAMSTFTDVSPVGITIDSAALTRVSFLSVGTSLVVSDGVNRPWVMTNFGATPVTGAYIDIDGAAGSWSAWGRPTAYEDSVFFITQTVPGGSSVTPRVGIVWSEPNQPTVGYTQTGFADFWNLIETGTDPLYAILGTNNGLFYWREAAIGLLAGTPSLSFSTTATRDARSTAVGSTSPYAIVPFSNNIFFLDNKGRPWMMPADGDPKPIWKQVASLTNAMSTSPARLGPLAIGSVVPELDHVLLAFSTDTGSTQSPGVASLFDGATGNYVSEWTTGGLTPMRMDAMAVQKDSNGVDILSICGGAANTGLSGSSVWNLFPISAATWSDAGGVIPSVQTGLLGYAADRDMMPDYATLILNSSTVVDITYTTPAGQQTFNGVSPAAAPDATGQFRAVLGLDGCATRWCQFTIATGTITPSVQWGVQRVAVYGSTCAVGPEEW